ncbi:MAG: GNAT family N-acetyltransferase [Verrucomicrobia bacterium]|nr:GNAT family N-acetyltransferase [Cytophagales bacterium]
MNVEKETLPTSFPEINLPATQNLDFEALTFENTHQIYRMFRWDWNLFVSAKFKSRTGANLYAAFQLEKARFSKQHGACDWFFKTKTGEFAGMLHLYDLSQETFADRHKRCTIGFATTRKFRSKGLTTEAVNQLLRHLFEHLEMQMVLSYTKRNNKKAIAFLEKLGFANNDQAYTLTGKFRYFEITREKFLYHDR